MVTVSERIYHVKRRMDKYNRLFWQEQEYLDYLLELQSMYGVMCQVK